MVINKKKKGKITLRSDYTHICQKKIYLFLRKRNLEIKHFRTKKYFNFQQIFAQSACI